jgi:hypothetical protein
MAQVLERIDLDYVEIGVAVVEGQWFFGEKLQLKSVVIESISGFIIVRFCLKS